MPHLGVHPCGHHQSGPPAGSDQGARDQHIHLVSQGSVWGERIPGLLLHRHRLPRHGRFVGLEAAALQDPGVGGDLVPRLQKDHVPGHQSGGGHPEGDAVPQGQGGGRGHAPQLLQGLLGVVLLGDGDDRVDHHDHQNDRPVQPVLSAAGRQRQPRRRQQHQNHGVLQLGQDPNQQTRGLRTGQLVGTVLLQPLGRLPLGQALGPAPHLFHHLRYAPAVPAVHTLTLPSNLFQYRPGLSWILQNCVEEEKERGRPVKSSLKIWDIQLFFSTKHGIV